VTFAELNLNKALLNALDDLGFTETTPIQEQSFSVIMSGRDVVGIAQTGTGKTFAYSLPLLRLLKFSKQKAPRVLMVVPTRELVIQLVADLEKLTTYTSTRVVGVYGGTNINTQKDLVMEGVDVLVATPGRLLDLAYTGALRLKSIQKLVIDEVDEMLNIGFRPQITNLLDILPKKRQNLLFSATITPEVEDIIDTFFNHPVKIEIAPTGTPLDQIEQYAFNVPNFNTKANLLEFLLNQENEFTKVLVFIENKKLVDRLHEKLELRFPEQIGAIHSNKSQNYRMRAVAGFEDGTHRVLLATDLLARGLDISTVTHVINFDVPPIPENYMHRIGRTGRASEHGIAITFVKEAEEDLKFAIEVLMTEEIPMRALPEEVVISDELMPEEEAKIIDKSYLKFPKAKASGAAFHEKKDKNKKVNLGGSYRRNLKAKYKKPIKRSGKNSKKK